MPVDQLIGKKIGHLPRRLPVVNSLNGLLALFRLAFEEVVEINIIKFTSIKITNSVKETLTVRQIAVVPWEREEAIVP